MSPALLMSLLLASQNPVQIQLSSISAGDVQVARDGYLLVLGTDWRGLANVIYPSRPVRDGHVAAGTTVRLRSLRAATWVAVWSERPFDPDHFSANTYWSTDSLRRASDGASVDALVGIARRMAGGSEIAFATAKSTPASFVLVAPRRGNAGVMIPATYYRFLSPRESWVRQMKFAGGPPDVCNGSMCALSVWRQLGDMQFGNAPFDR